MLKDPNLLLLCKHAYVNQKPAHKSWVELYEVLQVKSAYSRIQLPADEKVVEAALCISALCYYHRAPVAARRPISFVSPCKFAFQFQSSSNPVPNTFSSSASYPLAHVVHTGRIFSNLRYCFELCWIWPEQGTDLDLIL